MARYDDENEGNECSNLSSHSLRSRQLLIYKKLMCIPLWVTKLVPILWFISQLQPISIMIHWLFLCIPPWVAKLAPILWSITKLRPRIIYQDLTYEAVQYRGSPRFDYWNLLRRGWGLRIFWSILIIFCNFFPKGQK